MSMETEEGGNSMTTRSAIIEGTSLREAYPWVWSELELKHLSPDITVQQLLSNPANTLDLTGSFEDGLARTLHQIQV